MEEVREKAGIYGIWADCHETCYGAVGPSTVLLCVVKGVPII